ncbi:MAG: Ig-like domain-containing protein, partial [Planctomycetia bacterium]
IVEVVAIDAAFNRSQAAVLNPLTVDTIAPTVPVVASPALTNDNTPVIAGTAEPGSTVTVVIDGFTFTTTAANPGGAWSVDLQTDSPLGGNNPIGSLSDGVHPVQVVIADLAGNTSAVITQNLRVDTAAPFVPQITTTNRTNDQTPLIAGLAEPGSTVLLTIQGSNFNTVASPNGTWSVDLGTAIPNGGTTPIAPLIVGQPGYPVVVTVTDVAGNTSQSATQNLLVDTNAPDAPVFTSNPLTNQVPPTITGTAEIGSTLTLLINGATFNTVVDANGNWTVNTASAPISGTLGAFTNGSYVFSAYCSDGLNLSGTSTQTLVVDLTAPVITSAVASFGSNLNLDESRANATISVNISGIEDGQPVSIQINGSTFTGTVFHGNAVITVPSSVLQSIADGSNPSLMVSTTDRAGNPGSVAIPFNVDKTGPARPSFANITSGQNDPTPNDPFTSVVNPTVVISGEPGQTIVITGPNGVVDPSSYTVTETNGLYTITFTVNQSGGDYRVNLRDANGNLNADGNDAQNYFRIDSIPILFDNPERRSTSQGSTFGNLNIKNILNGQVF